jgi:RNA polymerase sigma-70 factor (ECF subfamily)
MTAVPASPSPAFSAENEADAELVAKIANGDLDALGVFFERYEPAVRRYLGRLGATESDADDLVQTTFLDTAHAAVRFDPHYPARTWLLGIATVVVRRHRRSLRRHAARLATWAGVLRRELAPSPAELFERDDAARRMSQALERLSPKKREVFVLVTLEGLSGEEAARSLGVPVKTVWTRLHHARLELRRAIGEVP